MSSIPRPRKCYRDADTHWYSDPRSVLRCQHGDRVVYACPLNGGEYDSVYAADRLKYGRVYTVECVSVGSTSSDLTLVEVPGSFNTVLFLRADVRHRGTVLTRAEIEAEMAERRKVVARWDAALAGHARREGADHAE